MLYDKDFSILYNLAYHCRNGSVVVDVLLSTAKGGSSVVQNKLLEVMGSNQLQNVTIDSFGVVKGKLYLFFRGLRN